MKSLDINRIMKISVIMLLLDAFWLSIITKPFLKMTKDIQNNIDEIKTCDHYFDKKSKDQKYDLDNMKLITNQNQ